MVVELLNAGDAGEGTAPVPVPGVPGVTEDTGNGWTLSTELTSYLAEATAA